MFMPQQVALIALIAALNNDAANTAQAMYHMAVT
jgi:hypothetical protein